MPPPSRPACFDPEAPSRTPQIVTRDLGAIVKGVLQGPGLTIDLDDGSFSSPEFSIDADGSAHFSGTLDIASISVADIACANFNAFDADIANLLLATDIACNSLSILGNSVSFGAPDSGGPGFRFLLVPN